MSLVSEQVIQGKQVKQRRANEDDDFEDPVFDNRIEDKRENAVFDGCEGAEQVVDGAAVVKGFKPEQNGIVAKRIGYIQQKNLYPY